MHAAAPSAAPDGDRIVTPPLLLLGAQRSGTTALASKLSEAYGRAGGTFTVNGKLLYLLRRWCKDEDIAGRHLRADEILHALDRRPAAGAGAEGWAGCVEVALRSAAAEVAAGWKGSAVELVRRILAESYGSGEWGNKYNETLLDLPWVHALYPRARYLLVIRHPVEVAASMLAWRGDRPWRPRNAAAVYDKWTAWHQPWLRIVGELAPENWLVVDYEGLCGGRLDDAVRSFVGLDLGALEFRRRRALPPHDRLPLAAALTWRRLGDLRLARQAIPQGG